MKNELVETKSEFWWQRETVRFECLKCGGCCGGEPGTIWVTAAEISQIAEFIGEDETKLRENYLTRRDGRSSIKELENYDCVFLRRSEGRCAIYSVRPLQCRLFPFWPSILRDKNIWNYYAFRCPGMDKGKIYTSEMIQSLKNYNIWQDL